MNNIAIYGAGGLGREISCLIRQINEQEPQWNLLGFFVDDPLLKGKQITHFGPCLGGIEELNSWDEELAVVLAISDPQGRKMVYGKITNQNISFPNLVNPNNSLSDPNSFVIGRGNIIQGGCSATCDIHIGDFNLLNGNVYLGHDVEIGSFNSFMPTVRISGNVKIGQGNFFGVGSIVIEELTIGNSVRLAAGSVLMTKPKDGSLYLGIPAMLTEY